MIKTAVVEDARLLAALAVQMWTSHTSKGIQAIRLDAFSQNPYALKLYKNLGYSQVGCADWRKGRFYLMEKYI